MIRHWRTTKWPRRLSRWVRRPSSKNQALLDVAKVNLGYTTINSPVEGTVIARRVNKGQTVSASLSAPSLFLIAKDLRRMEVWAAVNEADIGRIQKNMTARFTVDTFPNETFSGTVTQIRLNASMSSKRRHLYGCRDD